MRRFEIKHGDWIDVLRTMPNESVQCCVTSPPYWGLRDYGVSGQLGLERTPEEYVAKVVAGFREVSRVLRKDGTCWINLGDSYSNDTKWGGKSGGKNYTSAAGGYQGQRVRRGKDCDPKRGPAAPGQPMQQGNAGLKPKDLVGMPWRVAFALQGDGWFLRAQCPWIKRNSMPESVADRPGTATETIFLLSKCQRYFYDAEAVKMPAAGTAHSRGNGVNPKAAIHNATRKDRAKPEHMRGPTAIMNGIRPRQNESFSAAVKDIVLERGRRNHDWFMDSWEGLLTDDDGDPLAFVVNPNGYSEAHFATFPPKLVEPCILAGCPEGGTVLDPFAGAGTTGLVALRLGRAFLGIELKQEYIDMANCRITGDAPLFNLATATE